MFHVFFNNVYALDIVKTAKPFYVIDSEENQCFKTKAAVT